MNTIGKITAASGENHPQIQKIWEEVFTTDQQYLNTLFTEIFPYCRSFIYTEGNEVLSVASLLPMLFYSPALRTPLKGYYMFGVATVAKARGRNLASNLIMDLSNTLTTEGYDFLFERPANQSLNSFYLNLGFSIPIKKVQHPFNTKIAPCSPGNNPKTALRTLSNEILQEIRGTFRTRFEWERIETLEGLINLGELEYHNSSNTPQMEETYIAVKLLTKENPSIFKETFFCFPME